MKKIDKANFFTIAEREVSGMAGTRIEYLCLSCGEYKSYLLSVAGYEALAHVSDYYDEEVDDYKFPDAIEGKKVHGSVDDYLVGGDIWLNINNDGVEFDSLTDGIVILFIEKYKWQKMAGKVNIFPTNENIFSRIKEIISES